MSRTLFALSFGLWFLLAGVPAEADSHVPVIDLGAVDITNTIDRRTDLSPQAWRMAIFFARGGVPGHAYVALLTWRDDVQTFVADSVFGLYPDADQTVWTLGTYPGGIDVRDSDADPDIALLVWINPDQYAAIESVRDGYSGQGTYQLLFSDCVSLMADAARAIGLRTPAATLYPFSYVEELTNGNLL